MAESNDLIRQAAQMLHRAKRVTVLTGAGVSKESGVPTFRDAQSGLWAQYDPQELATPQAFERDPKLVWDWYTWRRELVGQAAPNAGHIALAKLQDLVAQVQVITQNVDDLHEQAGSRDVIHLHGNIARSKCFDSCQGEPTVIDLTTLADATSSPPKCPHCGAFVRPDVVWFGEMLPPDALHYAMRASQDCDVMLVVGTSGLVRPASQLPAITSQAGGTIIEVNPDYSTITRIADIKLEGASGVMLPQVIEAMYDAL